MLQIIINLMLYCYCILHSNISSLNSKTNVSKAISSIVLHPEPCFGIRRRTNSYTIIYFTVSRSQTDVEIDSFS